MAFQPKPKTFPASFLYKAGTMETEIPLANEADWEALIMNLGSLDAGKIQGSVNTAKSEGRALTTADLRECVRVDAKFHEKFANDGEQVPCGICLGTFQPLLIPFMGKDGGQSFGGNFATLKVDQLSALKGANPAIAEQVVKIAADATAAVLGDDEAALGRAVILPVCSKCRKLVNMRFYSRASAREGLLVADQKIGAADNRRAIVAGLGLRQRERRPMSNSGRPSVDRRGGYHDRDRREQKSRVDWHGASLEEATAAALTGAGFNSATEVLALSEGDMVAKGLAHEGSVKAIRFVLGKALEGRQVMPDVPVASAIGARPTAAKSTRPATKPRVKKVAVDMTASPKRGGGSVSLTALQGMAK